MHNNNLNTGISIIIVNYKTPKLLFDCINSIYENQYKLSLEIIVVDNDSKDESEQVIMSSFPKVLWVNMGYNSGFSRANNKGIRIANGNYILLLNSDTLIIKDCLVKTLNYYKFLESKNVKVGLLGCKMKDLNSNLLFNSNAFFPGIRKIWNANSLKILFSRKNQDNEKQNNNKLILHNTNHTCAWLGAAFVLCNKNIFSNNNLYMEEDFFMYGEDVEWCYRFFKNGYINYYYSEAEILHINCGSSGFSEWKNGQLFISEWLYFLKIKGRSYFIAAILLLLFNHALDSLFYLKQKITGNINENDKDSLIWRRFINSTIRRYFFRILFHYKRITSSSKTFLKYVVK